MDEQVLAGFFIDDAEIHPVIGIRPGIAIEYEQLAVLQVGGDAAVNGIELSGINRLVFLVPVDQVVNGRVVCHELVIGGAPGVFAGEYAQRAIVGQRAFAARQRLFHQGRNGQVAMDLLGVDDAQLFQIECHGFLHFTNRRVRRVLFFGYFQRIPYSAITTCLLFILQKTEKTRKFLLVFDGYGSGGLQRAQGSYPSATASSSVSARGVFMLLQVALSWYFVPLADTYTTNVAGSGGGEAVGGAVGGAGGEGVNAATGAKSSVSTVVSSKSPSAAKTSTSAPSAAHRLILLSRPSIAALYRR
jgi:hypothetical protein